MIILNNIEAVLFIIFCVWHYALRCGYISDDHATVEQRKDIIPDEEKNPKLESKLTKIFNDGVVMYYLTRVFWKLGFRALPFTWHAFSLFIHLANSYLLYLILTPVIGNNAALVSVLYWGINPMLNQNVVWISGRPYLLGVFLALLAVICWQNPIGFILFYGLSVVTNISIALLPILLYMAHPQTLQTKFYLISMVLIAFPFIIWKFNKRFTRSLVIDRENFKFRIRKFNTFARIIAYYFWTLFVPVRMGWYHQAGFRYNKKWEKFNVWTLCGYAIIFLMATKGGIAGWIFILGIIPNSNLYATNSFVQDRYTYFASIGLSILVAPWLIKYPPLFYCLVTFYSCRAYMYSRHMIDDEAMYRENWRNHPNSDYAVNNLSYFLIQQRRYEEARSIILRGLEIDRGNKMLWYNLGITWAATGHFNSDEGKFRFLRALDCWKMALQIEPRWTKPADDLKKLIQILVDRKVLTINKDESAQGISISVPALTGIEGILRNDKNQNPTVAK